MIRSSLLCIAALFFCAPLSAQDTVFISEFVASNSNGLRDENGDYSDWIEIFNGGTNTVNLDGWFLTDTEGNLTRWRFPATNLPPNNFLIVFASSKNRAVPGAPLHANFGLSAGGEYLALVRPDGVTVASEFAPFPEQFSNISYGIGQNLQAIVLVSNTSPARVFVATNDIGRSWISNSFNDSAWIAGTNGVGYQSYVSGFAVRNIRANGGVCDLSAAEAVLADPARQAAVFAVTAPVINYVNAGGGANFGGDVTYPGFTINVDENNFVTEATGILTIPTSGAWTFGVNSDDGFSVTIGANTFSYPPPRGPGDTLATFNLAAGDYPVRLLFYECGGGAEVEFFAASGTHSTFNASVFQLVGSTATGGLAVKSLPGAGGSLNYRPLIATDVQTQMLNRARATYMRIPFSVPDASAFNSLRLRMKYDDGFVAYLNGVEIARRNAPANPLWNTAASSNRPNQLALIFEDIEIPGATSLLLNGANLLAIHGLNEASNSPEYLQHAEFGEYRVLGLTNHYFSTPSPGALNGAGFYAFVDNLEFTPGRGLFENTNFFVTIESGTPGVTIRYTLDGSAPTITSGLIYSPPGVLITNTTLIRTIGYRSGFEPTKIETHSYIFVDQVQAQTTNGNWAGGSSGDYTLNPAITQNPLYRDTFRNDLRSIPTLSIVMTWADVFGPNGVWSNPLAEGVGWERPCSLEYIRHDDEDGFNVNCGIRIQGGASRSLVPKHGLRVLFKNIYGPGKLTYPLYPDSPVQEFDTLTIHATFNDHWLWGAAAATMQRDQWCRDAQNAMGGYGPHGTYVHLYLNGLYWGLYNIGEKGDASYAAHYLGGEKEEYDAFNSDELIDGNANAWNTMFAIAGAGITNDVAYTNLSQYLNIPNFINYMLMNFYAATTDWPWHNWNAARRRAPGAGFHFFSWDAEWSFGIGNDVNTDRTGLGAGDGSPGRLYAALRAHPEFRRQFGDHAQKYLFHGGALTPGPTRERWTKRAAEIDRAIIPESARWGAGYTHQTWLGAQSSVLAWFPQRTGIVLNQLRNAGLYPQLSAPAFSSMGGLVPPGYTLVLTNPNPSGTIYFTTDGSDPRRWGGAIAASARAYSAPLVLTNVTVLRARVFNGSEWSALVEATFYIVQDFSALKLTEIMYNPPPFATYPGDELEFLELKNTGTNTLDLSGLEFTDGITYAFPNGTVLAPGAFFVLARNQFAFGDKYPGVTVQGLYEGRLDNGGEELTIAHLLGTNVLSLSYDDDIPWPITADGHGFSLVYDAVWRASAIAGGSPGADDPPASITPVVINEILTHTVPPVLDAIELRNPLPASVDIGGWFLSDGADRPTKFRIPNGTTVSGGSFVVFNETHFNQQPGVPPSFALNSRGEKLYLFSGGPATNLTGYSHGIDYGAAAAGVTFGRYVISTGEEHWPAMTAVTLNAPNSAPRIGPLVINEIMYHPATGYDEFIEIHNLSASSVPLYDPAYPTNAWKLNGLGFTFSNNVSLSAGGYLLLAPLAPNEFRTKYGVPAAVQIFAYAGVLQNSGERLRLERPDTPNSNGVAYIVVDEVRYNDKLPWPAGADGDGPSLQRRAPNVYGNEPTNWFASGITPGAANVFNTAPICALLWPTNDSTFVASEPITLRASASDPDGTIVRVEFYDGDALLASVTNAPYELVWRNATVGTHMIVAKARDNGLAVTPSAPATITVQPPPIGTGIGLRADYFDNMDFTGTRVRRIDPIVGFDWGLGQPDPAIAADQFSVRWIGHVQPRFTETYTFHTISDDGVRLWVNNQILVDNWTDHGPTENIGFIPLQAGQLYDIKMEMYENGGGATAQLFWSAPSVVRELIPSAQLYPPASSNLPPSVALTSPSTGAVFVATSTIDLAANANDLDGAIFKVEFFAGAAKLGEDTASPFNFAWPNVPAGSHTLRAIAIDDSGLTRTSAPVNITVVAGFTTNLTLISTGAVWRYHDKGQDLGTAWAELAFDDSGWSNGAAQLGYGDGDETTIVGFGPNGGAKYITTYFRRAFNISDPTYFTSLNLRVMRDDGVIVYLNGSEVFRHNMPGGVINYLTLASVGIGGADESTFYATPVNPGYLVFGANVLAAEIHQNGGGSTDISFELSLTGQQSFIAPHITTHPQSQTVSESSVASLAVVAGGTAPLRYQWRFNGVNLSGANGSALSFASVAQSHAGSYDVVITNIAGTTTSLVAVLTVSTTDRDGDGMPDAWEIAHGLNPDANDAPLDADGDTMPNHDEFIAGTHPQDNQSYLKVDSITGVPGACLLQFQAVSNRTYAILHRPAAHTGPWSAVTTIPSRPTNYTATVLDPTPVSTRFYRLLTPASAFP